MHNHHRTHAAIKGKTNSFHVWFFAQDDADYRILIRLAFFLVERFKMSWWLLQPVKKRTLGICANTVGTNPVAADGNSIFVNWANFFKQLFNIRKSLLLVWMLNQNTESLHSSTLIVCLVRSRQMLHDCKIESGYDDSVVRRLSADFKSTIRNCVFHYEICGTWRNSTNVFVSQI